LCHGTVCVVGKIRDLILQLSKSSIYSTKPLRVKPQVMELLPEKVVFFRLRSFERNSSCYKIEEPNSLAFKK
ncbi:hypothetical protein M2A80_28735, partial [Klebsiella pneumoniae]|nr:hypothetical protein [Klebsiella pneumoniae]